MKHLITTLILLILTGTAVSQPPLMWEHRAKGTVQTDLLIDGGVIIYGTSGKKLEAVNASTGRLERNYTSSEAIYSTPTATGEAVHFGCDNHMLYSLNKSTYRRVWTYPAEGKIRSQPVVDGGFIYFGSYDGNLHCIYEGSGNPSWRYKAGSQIESKPYLTNKTLYFGTHGKKVVCLDRSDGSLIWNTTLRGTVKSDPTMHDEILYVTAGDRRLYALDAASGKLLYNVSANQSILSSPMVYDGRLYYADRNWIYSLDPGDGSVIWKRYLEESIYASPLVEDGIVYVAAGKILYALNASGGQQLWALETEGYIRKKPAVEGDRLYLAHGSTVQGYGKTVDVKLVDVETNPLAPLADRGYEILVECANAGDALAAEVKLSLYVDRQQVGVETLTLKPREKQTIVFNHQTGYGTHLIEAVLDEDEDLIESNRENNIYGVVYYVKTDWPTIQQNNHRTGFTGLDETLQARDTSITWNCEQLAGNTTYTLTNVSYVWDRINESEGYSLAETRVNASCSHRLRHAYQSGYAISNWSCTPYNTSGIPEMNLKSMVDYVNSFNETAYNLSIRQHTLRYPFNVSDFTVYYNCTTTDTYEIPLKEATLEWSCKLGQDRQVTPYNLTDSWDCQTRYESRYSLDDFIIHRGYGRKGGSEVFETSRPDKLKLLWNHSTGDKVRSSPILVDLNGAGDGVLETVFGSYDGHVYAVDYRGELLWRTRLDGKVYSVSAYDIDLDGRLEILAGSESGKVTCLNGYGNVKWVYDVGGKVEAAPMALNLDISDNLEIVFGAADKNIYALTYDGRLLWKYATSDYITSSPSVADVDGDGTDEVIMGSDNNIVYALSSPPYRLWTYQTNGDISASPTSAYIYGTRLRDLIIASADGTIYNLYKSVSGSTDIGRVCDLEGCRRETVSVTRLRPRWTYDCGSPIHSSPAVADLDQDGEPELVFGNQDRNLYIVSSQGERKLRYTTDGPIYSSPALGDLDHDGLPEIVFGSDDGIVYVFNSSWEAIWKYQTKAHVRSSPALADLDNDGSLELVVGSDDGNVYAFGHERENNAATTTSKTTSTTVTTIASTTSSTTTASITSTTQYKPSTTTTVAEVEAKTTESTKNNSAKQGLSDSWVYVVLASLMALYFYFIINPRTMGL